MKIVLFGKSGMLGSSFLHSLKDEELFAYDHQEIDISDCDAIEQVISGIMPDFVINCAAYTHVDACEKSRDFAFLINGEAAGNIAKVCKKVGAKLIHFSSDYVFDGENPEGYEENDEPTPINVYGESKLAGEKLIAAAMEDYYIVRTSWLFGEGGKNFVETMLELARVKKELAVVGDQIGSPTYAKDLCAAVVSVMVSLSNHDGPRPGIYHLTNSGACSWHEFAKEIFRIKGIEIPVKKISSEELKRPAKRPKYSILKNTKIKEMRGWKEALGNYLSK